MEILRNDMILHATLTHRCAYDNYMLRFISQTTPGKKKKKI